MRSNEERAEDAAKAIAASGYESVLLYQNLDAAITQMVGDLLCLADRSGLDPDAILARVRAEP